MMDTSATGSRVDKLTSKGEDVQGVISGPFTGPLSPDTPNQRPIVFDLDGVLRDLTVGISTHLGKPFDPVFWNERVANGLDLCQYISLHPEILIDSPTTEYFSTIVENCPSIEILTCQPLQWIPYTKVWLKEHLPFANVVWCSHPEEKLEWCERNNAIIFEDYPVFSSYDRVILVDQPYNYQTKAKRRVRSVEEMKKILEELHEPAPYLEQSGA